jgi:phage virion morphogenesis protein
MGGVRGDFAKLRGLEKALRAAAAPGFRRELYRRLSETALSECMRCFEEERSPHGQRWKKLKHREGRILRDTGRLAASIYAGTSWTGFYLATRVSYAAIHNFGGTVSRGRGSYTIDARPFIPSSQSLGLWLKPIQETCSEYMKETLP